MTKVAPSPEPATTAGNACVLVARASRHGATRGIAERTAARLGENGVYAQRNIDDWAGRIAAAMCGP